MKKNHRLMTNFLTSNLIILAIPCVISLILYILSSNIIEDHAQKNYYTLLEHSKNMIDSQLEEIHSIGNQIALTPSIISLLNNAKTYTSNKKQYSYYKVFNETKHFQLTNNLIIDYYLMVKEQNATITSEGIYQTSLFLKMIDDKHAKYLLSFINDYHYNTLVNATGFTRKANVYNSLLYVLSLPIGNQKKINSTLFIIIDKNRLKQLFPPFNQDSSSGLIYVVDSNKAVIMEQKGNDCVIDSNQIDIDSLQSGKSLIIDNKKYVVTYTHSKANNWTYVSVIPEKTVYIKLNYFSFITLILFSCFLVIGLIVSYYMANRNVKPVTEIISIVKELKNETSDSRNEYSIINNALQKLIYTNNDMRERLEDQKPVLEANFLRNLLAGKFTNKDEIISYFDYINLDMVNNNFIVLLLSIKGYEGLINEQTLKEFDMAKVVISNILDKHFTVPFYVYDRDEKTMAILLNYSNISNSCTHEIDKVSRNIQHELSESYYIYVSFAIGNSVDDVLNIHHSYTQAKKALNYVRYQPDKDIIWFTELPSDTNHFYYPFEIEIELVTTLKSGDTLALKSILETIFNENFVIRDLSYDKILQLINIMKGTIYRELEEHFKTKAINELLIEMDQSESVDEIFNYIIRIHTSITQSISQKQENVKVALKKNVIDFIQNNYKNSTLTLFDLANHFDYSEAYMYQFFKDHLGITYSSYLEKFRIEQACHLISSQNHSIKDISRLVGYNNDNTFRRAFKRIMNVTPSVYKNAISHDNSIK